MSKDRFRLTEYEITDSSDFLDKQNAVTPGLRSQLDRYHKLALQGKKSNIPKILEAIEKHPKNPQLKNYLSVLYSNMGDTQKSYDVNKWLIAEHPDYLFGKLNLASEHYAKGEYEEIPKILGQEMEIKSLYPQRDIFHFIEVTSFYKIAVLYYAAIGKFDDAEMRVDIMKKIAPDHADTEFVTQQLRSSLMEAGMKRMAEEEKLKIKVLVARQESTKAVKSPVFTHQEIAMLYNKGLYIEKEALDRILQLPRETLIIDLEKVLEDSIKRFSYFFNLVEKEGWDEESMNFVVHAVFLLGELKAEESLDKVFHILSQSEEYLELYFGDFITSTIWEPIYKISYNQLARCKQFMYLPGIYTYAKTLVLDIAEQVAHHHPERRNEVVEWYTENINIFLNSSLADNIIDSDVIGLMICNILDLKTEELLPEIEKLFERGIVSTGICGTLADVKQDFNRPKFRDVKKEILPIADRYKDITETWWGYTQEDDNYDDDFNFPQTLPRTTESSIGRNDPCPCGSGKKYKKCCMN